LPLYGVLHGKLAPALGKNDVINSPDFLKEANKQLWGGSAYGVIHGKRNRQKKRQPLLGTCYFQQ
jgi:hypothetical protein